MRIIQVLHGFPPYNMAGSEVYTYNLSKELAKQHKVTVFHRVAIPQQEEYATEWGEYEGLKVFAINNTFKHYASFESTYKNDVIAQKFGAFLDETKPDIVHFGHLTCLSTTCIKEAQTRNIPIVFTLHDYWLISPRAQFLKRDLSLCHWPKDSECVKCMAYQLDIEGGHQKVSELFEKTLAPLQPRSRLKKLQQKAYSLYYERFFFPAQSSAIAQIRERRKHIKEMCSLVDLFIAPSQFLRQKFIEFGIPEIKIIYSDYGFDTTLFEGISRKPADHIRFGYIGTLIPSKGVHILIEAFNKVQDEKANLKVFGNYVPYDGIPNYLDYLEGLVKNERIKLMGPYDNKNVGMILSDIDVLIVPSIWFENSPLTIHEAFLAGVPVITSNVGGMAELIQNGVNGLHFEMGNSGDLYQKIKRVIENPSIIDNLQKNISQVKTIKEAANEFENIYDTLTQSKVNHL